MSHALQKMIGLARAEPPARLGSEFDDFLFSSVGDDRNGLTLSVASMLARLNLDPWQEAAQFAGLPVAAATQNLTSLIAALPDEAFRQIDPAALATRLVALLPRKRPPNPANPASPAPPLSKGPGTTLSRRQLISRILIALFLGFLATQFFLSSRDSPPLGVVPPTQAPSTDVLR